MKVYIVWDEKHNDHKVFPETSPAKAFDYFCMVVRQTFREMGSKYCTEVNGVKQAFDDNGRNVDQAIEYKSTIFGGRKIAFEEGILNDNL